MKTTYELSGVQGLRADPASGGNIQLTARDGDVTVRLVLTADNSLSLKRNLARLVDAEGGYDPADGGFSIRRLVDIRKDLDSEQYAEVDPDLLIDVVNAYIRLIEVSQQKKQA